MNIMVALMAAFLCVCGIDLFVARRAFRHKDHCGMYLGLTCVGSAVVTLSYFISLFVRDYFLYSLMTSVYFAGIDFTLMFLLRFAWYFTKGKEAKQQEGVKSLLNSYLLFDVLILMVNPFKEIVISYVPRAAAVAHYSYRMLTLFRMHLLYTYLLVGLSLYLLVSRMLAVPGIYRSPYRYAVLTIVAVVGLNACYLFLPVPQGLELLDYSLLGYSICAQLLYWNCFSYAKNGLMKHFHSWIFENVGQGLVLFDFDNTLVLHNAKAKAMLPDGTLDDDCKMGDFLEKCGMPKGMLDNTERASFQCYLDGRPTRCDVSVQLGEHRKALGHLFVLSQASEEYDVLTGFYKWDFFQKESARILRGTSQPLSVAVFDLIGLSDINRTYGMEKGDRAIQRHADVIRSCFPAGTIFVRCREAYLTAICAGMDREEIEKRVAEANAQIGSEGFFDVPLAALHAIATKCAAPEILNVLRDCVQTIRMKKLMDRSSVHSELLTSLVQALEQCDGDTSAHTYRTQRMGEELGKRIGLTEKELSSLALLAILHDIGKIGIPLEILNKPGKLSANEWNVLKSHVQKGYRIASSSQELAGIAEMILYHHERWDGKGYPDGLSGESIPLLSRIIAVVDAYDAMTNDRSYRKALPEDVARYELRRCAGAQFDPNIVEAFLQMLEEGDGIRFAYSDEEEMQARYVPQPSAAAEQGPGKQWSVEAPDRIETLDRLRVHPMQYSRYVLDSSNHIIEVDEEFEHLTGYSWEDVVERSLTQSDLIFQEDQNDYFAKVRENLGRFSCAYIEHRICRKDGSSIYVYCFGREFFDSATREKHTEIIVSDTTLSYTVQTMADIGHSKAQKRLEQWENKYRRDTLTGLPSQEAFESDVHLRLTEKKKKLMLVKIAVDGPDGGAQAAEDEFLALVGQMLMDSMSADDLACRMDGGFAALLSFDLSCGERTMLMRGQQLCDKVNMTLTYKVGEGRSLSMGGAFSDEECESFEQLCAAADQALSRARSAGKARFFI